MTPESATDRLMLARTTAAAREMPFTRKHVLAVMTTILADHRSAIVGELTPVPAAPQTKRKRAPKPEDNRNVIPPLPEWVTAYSAEIGYPMDGEAWCDSYQQKGWIVGKVKMKDWKSAVRNWKRSRYGLGTVAISGGKTDRDYSKPI